MKNQQPQNVLCKSVFMDGSPLPSKERFVKAWVNLINQTEKLKGIAGQARQ